MCCIRLFKFVIITLHYLLTYLLAVGVGADVSDERARMNSLASAADVDDDAADPNNGDCAAAVSFQPAQASASTSSSSAAEGSGSDPPALARSTSGDSSTVRRAAVAALSNSDAQRQPAAADADAAGAEASAMSSGIVVEEDEERELFSRILVTSLTRRITQRSCRKLMHDLWYLSLLLLLLPPRAGFGVVRIVPALVSWPDVVQGD